MFPNWTYDPQGTTDLQGTAPTLQGGSDAIQGSTLSVQGSSPTLQPTANPMDYVDPEANTALDSTTSTAVDPAAAAAAAKAAADAALAGQLRTQVTDLVNSIKDIYNTRYGQIDKSAGEQSGKLSDRFTTESGDLTRQIGDENNAIGAAHAARGTFDSSYRGNNVDTTTRAGQAQIRDLGQELQDNIAKIASWVSSQKTGIDAQKGGLDSILSHLAESTDPAELTQLRNTIEGRLSEVQAGQADYNTTDQNLSALESIAPSSTRAVKLKTTLSQIIAGNADTSQKNAIAQSLISNSGLTADEQQKLAMAFQSDLSTADQTKQPTA